MIPPRRVFPVGSEGPSAGAASSGMGPGGGASNRGQGAGGSGRPLAVSRPADPGPPPMTASGLVRRPRGQSPFADLDGPPPGLDQPAGSEDAEGDRPMYSWNPSDTTEAFPVVRPPGDSRPG